MQLDIVIGRFATFYSCGVEVSSVSSIVLSLSTLCHSTRPLLSHLKILPKFLKPNYVHIGGLPSYSLATHADDDV